MFNVLKIATYVGSTDTPLGFYISSQSNTVSGAPSAYMYTKVTDAKTSPLQPIEDATVIVWDLNTIERPVLGWVAIAETDKEALKIAQRGDQLIGGAETVKERIRAFIDVGVEYFIRIFRDLPRLDGPHLFAREVIPELRRK